MRTLLHSFLVAVLLWGVAVSGALAAVYQCKGVNGVVAFTDRPCNEGAKGSEINVRPASGSAPSPLSKENASPTGTRAATRDPVEAVLTPACRDLHVRMTEVVMEKSRLTEPEIEVLANRYTKECMPLIRAAQEKDQLREKRQADVETKRTACDAKRKVVARDRSRWAELTESGRIAVMAVEKEIASDCH